MTDGRPTGYCGSCGGLVPICSGKVEGSNNRRWDTTLPPFSRWVRCKLECGHGSVLVMTLWALRELWQWTGAHIRSWSWIDEEITCMALDGHTAPAWRQALARKAPAR